MNLRPSPGALRWAAAVGLVMSLIATALIVANDGFDQLVSGYDAFIAVFVWFFAVFVWLAAPREASNPVVWTMAASVLFGGLLQFVTIPTTILFGLEPTAPVIPAQLPTAAAWLFLVSGWMWIPALVLPLTFGFLLFPDGRLPSPRWLPAGYLAGTALILISIGTIWTFRPSNPAEAETGLAIIVPWMILVVAAILSVAGLITRFLRSTGETRQQIKWVIAGATIFMPAFLIFGFVLSGTENEDLLPIPIYAALIVFLLSYGMAVGKYRLYDIDVVISRTFVYGTLAVFITVVYVGAVVGIGRLFGGGDQPNPVLAIGATAVVAVAFQPLRRRLQSVANRLVYGRRATPYEVLSTFSQRVAAVDPNVLTQIAAALVDGTTADAAGVWMTRGPQRHLIAQWPAEPPLPPEVAGDDAPRHVRAAEVVHDGEPLGLVTLSLRPGQPFSPVDAALLDQVAAGLGLALRNLRLTENLRGRLGELRESRRRIVAVQDMTRRRLERDLHDGAQQRLVSLKIKLGISARMAAAAELDDVQRALGGLRDEADQAIDSVRDFARGIYPPLLESDGLETALVSRTGRLTIPVVVQAASISRYGRDVEATVYFCVLEAVQNAVRHSEAGSVLVVLEEDSGELRFEVRDDGRGFDVASVMRRGLINLEDRLDALDGSMEIISSPGRGTTVIGVIPIEQMAVLT